MLPIRQTIFVGAMVCLTACASSGSAQPQGHSPLASSPLPTAEWSMPDSDTMIIFERSGGIAGVQETWRFFGDGRAVREERRKGAREQMQLSADVVNDAVQRIVEGGFMDLAEEYVPDNPCCDRFTYRLTVVSGGTVKTVTTMDAAAQPPALAEALAIVNGLISQTGAP